MIETYFLVTALVVFVLFVSLVVLISRYKRCPSDKILVVYGKTGQERAAKCMNGGATFVIPVLQDYAFMDLQPISIEVDLRSALSKQNIRVNVPSQFTVGISTEPGVMDNAAARLLGMDTDSIKDTAENIITGQLRLVVATMDIEEINADRDKFLDSVFVNVEGELNKIGLKLINVNITDIEDESGYIEALGKEAAAKAINDAKQSVAEKNRDGAIGAALAEKDQRIQVSSAEAFAKSGEADAYRQQRIEIAKADSQAQAGEAAAERQKRIEVAQAIAEAKIGEAQSYQMERIQVAEANAEAVEGENTSKIQIANSEANRREREAEALRKAVATEKIQNAKALEEAYLAEKLAEEARAQKEMATREADLIVKAQIAKRQAEIDAEAVAETTRREAKGEADAIFLKKEAEAKGLLEMLEKQAQGFDKIVEAANGDPKGAVLMMIADKLDQLVEKQADAIKNIKIDKVTVWETGNNKGGGNATSNFISGLYKSVPPLKDMFNMAGMNLPGYLGQDEEKAEEIGEEE
jgi:flotillin